MRISFVVLIIQLPVFLGSRALILSLCFRSSVHTFCTMKIISVFLWLIRLELFEISRIDEYLCTYSLSISDGNPEHFRLW